MKFFNEAILLFLFLFSKINCDDETKKVFNIYTIVITLNK